MKKPPANDTEVPVFQGRPFLCPHCDRITAVETPMEYIFMKRVSCKHCHKQFLIRNDKSESRGCGGSLAEKDGPERQEKSG